MGRRIVFKCIVTVVNFLLILLSAILISANCEETIGLTLQEIQKLSLKQLKSMLWERGLECKGCAEKVDFATLLSQNMNSPIVRSTDSQNAEKKRAPKDDNRKDADMEEVYLTYN